MIDGDTIDVRYDGRTHRVRLLNIDTPETKDPNEVVECLGPEATEKLESLLNEGDQVRLEYDVERKFREARLYQVAPISTNLVLSYIGEHVLGMPRSY